MKGKLQDKLRLIFYIKDPPWKIALTFSIGIFIGMSPLIGLHTVIALTVALIFRLNKLVILIATYMTNPWTIVPIYTFSTFIGAKVLHREIKIEVDWSHLSLGQLMHGAGTILLPFITGTLIVGTVAAVLSYIIIYAVLSKRKKGFRRSEPPG